MAGEIKINLGCGIIAPAGWINIDGHWGAWLAKHKNLRKLIGALKLISKEQLEKSWEPNTLVIDVRKPLPFNNDSISIIYASHLIEHLYLSEAKKLIKECYRVLKPKGIIRFVVPDLRAIMGEYSEGVPIAPRIVSDGEVVPRAEIMNKRLWLRRESPPTGNLLYRILTKWDDLHIHKWMYDIESLIWHLSNAGFVEIAQMQALQSRIQDIDNIEKAENIVDGAGVCAEGIKPYNT